MPMKDAVDDQTVMTFSNEEVGKDPEYKYDVMDPLPGQKYVEYSKDGDDGEVKVAGVDCGLDLKKKGKYFYLSKVEHPAPSDLLNVGDRVIAINGKKIEKYGSMEDALTKMNNNNVVRLVVDPTLLRKK